MKRGREEVESEDPQKKKAISVKEFYKACVNGNVHRVGEFCSNGINVDFKEEKYQQTGLHIAALQGHADVAKVLLQNGADVNAVDKQKKIESLLKKNGLSINKIDN